jgi:hypothetical protein
MDEYITEGIYRWRVKSTGWTKIYPRREYTDYYHAGGLKI